ncbi:hypothetical protein [Micromonospora chersina]|uniref:hypothetical protein n=1 Tax=Micromonospora chersina TaxID=47854 RepID=UPI0033F8697E
MGALLTVVAWVVAALLVAWLGGPLLRWACRTRYGWIIRPLHEAGSRPAVAVLVIGALLACP